MDRLVRARLWRPGFDGSRGALADAQGRDEPAHRPVREGLAARHARAVRPGPADPVRAPTSSSRTRRSPRSSCSRASRSPTSWRRASSSRSTTGSARCSPTSCTCCPSGRRIALEPPFAADWAAAADDAARLRVVDRPGRLAHGRLGRRAARPPGPPAAALAAPRRSADARSGPIGAPARLDFGPWRDASDGRTWRRSASVRASRRSSARTSRSSPRASARSKGLCPFHDERSPSFHVRPQVGRYHCFGCGEGGDVIAFVQQVDGLGFTEAVEYLASRVGIQLRYEEGGAPRPGDEPGRRRRLIEAHAVAEDVLPRAARARRRPPPAARSSPSAGFDRSAAEHFGVGFAPQGWDALLRHLRGRGFTEAELTASGLVSQGQRGVYDRFRGRLVWPIREVTGETVGFGARRLFEEDQGPKYLNTPETPLYRKSHVLYGIDLAKRDMQRDKRVVVVEGYTDVMAMHLSGVGHGRRDVRHRVRAGPRADRAPAGRRPAVAAAACSSRRARRWAARSSSRSTATPPVRRPRCARSARTRRFSAQTFVAVEPSGMDPCELRQAQGPGRRARARRRPPAALRVRHPLDARAPTTCATAEGRVGALRAAAPVVAGIRDAALRPEYTRLLAGWLGIDDEDSVACAAARARRATTPRQAARGGGADGRVAAAACDVGPADGGARAAARPACRRPTVATPSRRPSAPRSRSSCSSPHLVPAEFDDLARRRVRRARLPGGARGRPGRGRARRRADARRPGDATAWVGAVIEEAAEPVRAAGHRARRRAAARGPARRRSPTTCAASCCAWSRSASRGTSPSCAARCSGWTPRPTRWRTAPRSRSSSRSRVGAGRCARAPDASATSADAGRSRRARGRSSLHGRGHGHGLDVRAARRSTRGTRCRSRRARSRCAAATRAARGAVASTTCQAPST